MGFLAGKKKMVASSDYYHTFTLRGFDLFFTRQRGRAVYLYPILMLSKEKIKNILVVRTDRFGEFLLNIPALRALKESYPQARLTLAVSPEVKALAECVTYADEVVVWDNNFKQELKKRKFGLVLILNPTKEAHWLSFRARIPVRVGYNRKWGFLLNRKIADLKHLGLKHEVEYNLDLAGLAEAKTLERSVSLGKLPPFPHPEYDQAIAVHPFTSDPLKQWPREKFRELAQRVEQELKLKVVVVGVVKENEGAGRELFEGLGSGIVNLINRTSLIELAQILKSCRLLISCDSGPMHLAAAVGTPVIALFRNDLPGKAAGRWGPWGRGNRVIEAPDLNQISVEKLLGVIKEVLSR